MHGCTIPVTYVACMSRQGSTLRYLLTLELGLVLQVNCETIDEYIHLLCQQALLEDWISFSIIGIQSVATTQDHPLM